MVELFDDLEAALQGLGQLYDQMLLSPGAARRVAAIPHSPKALLDQAFAGTLAASQGVSLLGADELNAVIGGTGPAVMPEPDVSKEAGSQEQPQTPDEKKEDEK